MGSFRAALFDLDGTLIATDRFWIQAARVGARRAFQELGLEWLYRVLREPKRLRRAFHLPRFVMKILEEKIGRDSRRRGGRA